MGTLSVDKLLKTSQGAAEFTLPATDGAAGQVWQTDGSGQLSVAALAADTVGTTQIATDAVTATEIAAGAVGTSEIGALAVTASEIAATTITPAQMAGSVFRANRNIIINGAMQLAQRTASIQKQYDSGNGCWAIDRMRQTVYGLDELVYTTSQQSDGPDRFANSLKMLVDTAETTITTNENFRCEQMIEGQNLQHLAYGTSSAESVTLSFWVKSNVTGVYAVTLYEPDGSRNIGSTYTISTSATWEYKTITFVGDTSGTIGDDDSTGLSIWWALSAGPDRTDTDNTSWATLTTGRNAYGHAVDVAGTASNYWQMTGVQLEIGITATPFEHKTFGRELEDCCRYYQNSYSSVTPDVLPNREDTVTVTSWQDGNSPFPVFPYVMRSSPTVTLRRNGATTTGKVRSAGTERAGVAGSIGKKLVSYITVTSGTATSDVIFSYELDAEL